MIGAGSRIKTLLDRLTLAHINEQVDDALDTAIPGAPTADSINDKIQNMSSSEESPYAPVEGDITLTDTSETGLEFLTGSVGSRFNVGIAFDLGEADVDYCRLDDGGAFTDQDDEAANLETGDVLLVPSGGSAIGDAIYFGCDVAFKRLDVDLTGGVVNGDNVFAWEGYFGGSWQALAGLSDGTNAGARAFEQSGKITWTSALASTTVNTQVGFWVRARVTTNGATEPIGSHMQQTPASGATSFCELAAFGCTLKLLLRRKMNGSYPTYQHDTYEMVHMNIDENPDINVVECQGDTKIMFQLDAAPTANITLPYRYAVTKIKA